MNVIIFFYFCASVGKSLARNPYNVGCGVSFHEPIDSRNKIVGTSAEAKFHSWPWLVSIHYWGEHYCSGTVISNQWILTASRCLFSNNGAGFPLSPHDLTVKVEVSDPATAEHVQIESLYVHPQYLGMDSYDIGLIKLKTQIIWSDKYQLICLPTQSTDMKFAQVAGTKFTVAGWVASLGSGYKLMEKDINVIDFITCWNTQKQFCTGGLHKSSCLGYIGSPLTKKTTDPRDGKIRWYQYGVVSGARNQYKPCDDKQSLYTRVSDYCYWIQKITGLILCS